MSVRQDVFNHMKKKPNAALDDVLASFSELKESTVRRYYFEYQKTDKVEAKPKNKKTSSPKKTVTKPKKETSSKKQSKKSIKEQVFAFMEKSPDAKLREVVKVFPKHQKTTIGNYRRQWLKDNESTKQDITKSKRSEIFSFLDNNPGSNINDLKKVFPEVASKLVTVFRSWKNSQSTRSQATVVQSAKTKKAERSETVKKAESTQGEQGWLEKHKDTITRQKEIIEKQKTKIEALKSQLPSIKRNGLIDSIKKFIIDKLSKN